MKPDDSLCLCFRVSLRKVQQFLAARQPAKASQLSECYGAGTGCGWCRRYLHQLHRQWQAGQFDPVTVVDPATAADTDAATAPETAVGTLPDAQSYAASRAAYRAARRSTDS